MRRLPRIMGHPGAAGSLSAGNLPQAPALPQTRGVQIASTSLYRAQTTSFTIRTGMAPGRRGNPSAGFSRRHPPRPHRITSVIDVFVSSTNGALWSVNSTNNGTTWNAWKSIGGQLASGTGPAADARGPNSLDVFVAGTNQVLYYTHWNGTTWSSMGVPRRRSGSWVVTRCDVTG